MFLSKSASNILVDRVIIVVIITPPIIVQGAAIPKAQPNPVPNV